MVTMFLLNVLTVILFVGPVSIIVGFNTDGLSRTISKYAGYASGVALFVWLIACFVWLVGLAFLGW